MRIRRIEVWQAELPVVGGAFRTSLSTTEVVDRRLVRVVDGDGGSGSNLAEVFSFEVTRLGGPTRAARARDLCALRSIPHTVDDAGVAVPQSPGPGVRPDTDRLTRPVATSGARPGVTPR